MVAKSTERDVNDLKAKEVLELAKEHKIMPPGRPIVSSVGSLTEPMSAFVDGHLQPALKNIQSFVKDTTSFLRILQDVELPKECLFATMDVSSLYTNIPHEDGIKAMHTFLTIHAPDSPANDLARIAEFVLKHNHFTFNGEHYLQMNGTAMGTKFAPAYASIFMAVLEEEFLASCEKKPLVYKRYIDDIFIIWTHGELAFREFFDRFNSFHPHIKFTNEVSLTGVNFLDVMVKREQGNDKLMTSVYVKPTDSQNYLKYDSFHPKHIKSSVVYSQMLRYRRIISSDAEFVEESKNLAAQFMRAGYPADLVEKGRKRAQRKKRDDLLYGDGIKSNVGGQEAKNVFVTTYHPAGKSLLQSVRKEIPILGEVDKLSEKHRRLPTHAQRQPPNLKRLLTRANVEKKSASGNKPCKKPRCQICDHIITDEVVELTQGLKVRNPDLNCNSKNVVYAIKCQKCPEALYIGETLDFRKRFNNHKSTIARQQIQHPVAEHFNKPNHTIKDLKCCLMKSNFHSFYERHLRELKIIVNTGSFKGEGLNKDLSWMSSYTFFR